MTDEKKTKPKEALKLIRLMKGDIVTALQQNVPLVIEGEGPLGALLTVIEVAEHATLKQMAPIVDPSGKLVM